MQQRAMANLDYTFMAKELQPVVHKFFDQFYELSEGRFRLKFGRDIILIELGVRLHKTKYVEPAPPATPFAMKVRKELKGKTLSALRQHGKDRVMVFDFEGTLLIAEMFGEGNLLLIRDGKILSAYSRKKWRGRSLLPGRDYSFPPSSPKTLNEVFAENPDSPAGSAFRDLDIGMSYVRAILKSAGVPDSKPVSSLSKEEKDSIAASATKLLGSLSPRVSYDGETPSSFSLAGSGKRFPTLSEALDEYYGPPEFGEAEKEEKEAELDKLNRLRESQEKRLEELKREERDAKECAEFINSHYEEFETLLSAYKMEGMGPIEELAKKKGWKLDKKEKVLEAEF